MKSHNALTLYLKLINKQNKSRKLVSQSAYYQDFSLIT
jgi:hypothetical protein